MNYIQLLQDSLDKIKVIHKCPDCKLYETEDEFYFVRTDFYSGADNHTVDTYINILYVMLFELGCNKKIKVAQGLIGVVTCPSDDIVYNFTNTGECFYVHDFKPNNTAYCQFLFMASSLGYTNAYQKLLEMYGDEIGIVYLKTMLKKNIYIDNNECRDILMRYINTHFNEGDIELWLIMLKR